MDCGLDATAKSLVMHFGARQSPLRYCEDSQAELAAELRCSIKRLSRALKDDVASGYVQVVTSHGLPARYTVHAGHNAMRRSLLMIDAASWQNVDLDGTAQALVVRLALRQFPLGYCEVSQKKLVAELRCSVNRLSGALKDPIAGGFIEICRDGDSLRYIVRMDDATV